MSKHREDRIFDDFETAEVSEPRNAADDAAKMLAIFILFLIVVGTIAVVVI